MANPLRISFEGAARTVTGSRHWIRWGEKSWLFDCGLYQGHRDEAERINRLLVENGHGVSHLSFEQESLEDIFLSLTGGGAR